MASFHSSHSFPAPELLCCCSLKVTADQHLHDLHTLHLFISGRDKKTPSPMSRSSSGFDSSHLPSPERPTHPQTLTASSPTHLPCVLPSLRPPKKRLTLVSPVKDPVPSGAISKSQSCRELRRNLSPGPLRRSFSVPVLDKNQLVSPKTWFPTPPVKAELSSQDTVTLQKACELTSLSSQSSAGSHNAECSTLHTDSSTVFEGAETTQRTLSQLPPAAPTEASNQPELKTSLLNPCKEPIPTQTPSLYDHTDPTSEDVGGRSLSATLEAHRLRMRTKRQPQTQ